MRTDIPHVSYFNWIEFLITELVLKVEIDHLMSIIEWSSAFNAQFNKGLASSHQIFNDAQLKRELKTNS